MYVHVRICIAAPSYTRSVQKCRKILKVASTPPRLSSLVSSPRSAPTSARIISNQPVGALVGVVYETCHAAKSRLTDRRRPVCMATMRRMATSWIFITHVTVHYRFAVESLRQNSESIFSNWNLRYGGSLCISHVCEVHSNSQREREEKEYAFYDI